MNLRLPFYKTKQKIHISYPNLVHVQKYIYLTFNVYMFLWAFSLGTLDVLAHFDYEGCLFFFILFLISFWLT